MTLMVTKMRKRKLPLYCCWSEDRHGKWRIRFRCRGFSCYIHSKLGTAEFKVEYQEALTGRKSTLGAGSASPGTFAKLIALYYKSPEFTGLRDLTKVVYKGVFERFKKEHGHKRVSHLERRHIKSIIGKMADRPHAANGLLKRLAKLMDLAVDLDWVKTNPVRGVKGYRIKSEGHHTWTEEEITSFEEAHPTGTKPRLAMTLLLYTASRRGDVITLGRQHMKHGRLRFTQNKTGAVVDIPIHQDLVHEIQAIDHDHLTFLITSSGGPFTPAGFSAWFRRQCNEAGVAHCSAHGLRKAATRRIIEAGSTVHQAAAVTGHKTLTEIAHYAEKADRANLAIDGIKALSKPKRRT